MGYVIPPLMRFDSKTKVSLPEIHSDPKTLPKRIAHWSRADRYGKCLLFGSQRWIDWVLGGVELALTETHPRVHPLGKAHNQLDLIPYENFIKGVCLTGDAAKELDLMTGWMSRRCLFVMERATFPKDKRYHECLEGLDCGSSCEFWWE